MRLNKTIAYGLACLHYLGENNGGSWSQVRDISRIQGLPSAYCNKVLQALVHAGFVESQKGKGYRLLKDLDEINVWELMESLTFNGAPRAEDEALSVRLYRTLHEEVNHWLVDLTVRDIVEITRTNDDPRQKEGDKGCDDAAR